MRVRFITALPVAALGSAIASGVAAQDALPTGVLGATCRGEARFLVREGVERVLAYVPDEARAPLELAAALDPRCGAAHLALALSLLPPSFGVPQASALRRGRQAVDTARAAGVVTAFERRLADALDLVVSETTEPFPGRFGRYRERLRGAVADRPQDEDAALVYAHALLWQSSLPGDPYQREAGFVLEGRFGRAPAAPVAAFLLLLARERPDAASAVDAADVLASHPHRLATLAHAPIHVYVRLGLWERAASVGRQALGLDPRADALRHGPGPYCGGHDWLVYALLQLGRDERAADVVAALQRVSDARRPAADGAVVAGRARARYRIERRAWREALSPRAPFDADSAFDWFVRGYGAGRLAWEYTTPDDLEAAERMFADGRAAVEALDALSAREAFQGETELLRLLAQASLAAAQEERGEVRLLLAQATALEAALLSTGRVAVPLLPAQEAAGDLWLQLRGYDEARMAYAAALQTFPDRPASWLGLARAAARAGDEAEACRGYARVADLWRESATRAGRDEAGDYVAAHRCLSR